MRNLRRLGRRARFVGVCLAAAYRRLVVGDMPLSGHGLSGHASRMMTSNPWRNRTLGASGHGPLQLRVRQ